MISDLYRFIVKYFTTHPKKKEIVFTDNYDLVIVCGPEDLDYLDTCLTSIFNNFEALPHVFIFTDPKVDMDKCKRVVRWFPSAYLNVIRGSDCVNYHLQHKQEALIRFVKYNPMGLKMAAILQMLNAGKLFLYCDPATLWYRDPAEAIKTVAASNEFELAMEVDHEPHYDAIFINKNELSGVNQPPYFSSGIILLKNISKPNYQWLQSVLETTGELTNPYIGETILAQLNRVSGDLALDKDQFSLKVDSPPGPQVIARSYMGDGRHLFWRDALKL
jgi:hypothetical protein